MTLSTHQKHCIRGMRNGEPLHMLIMHIRTTIKLEKLKLIEKTSNGYELTELGEMIKL